MSAAHLHIARTVSRRVERCLIPVLRDGHVPFSVVLFICRVSYFLFLCARYATMKENQEEVTHKIGLALMCTSTRLQPDQMLPELHPSSSSSSSLPKQGRVVTLLAHKVTVAAWSVADVCYWFSSLSLSQHYTPIMEENNINGEVLLNMHKDDWQEVGITNFGDIRILMLNIAKFH